jgi:hypothetical protein
MYDGFESDASSVDGNGGAANRWAGDTIHWEAVDWTLDPNTFWGQIEIDYQDEQENPDPRTFVIQRRLLEPRVEGEGGPMQGSDVAMLEEMLWQLGISGQFGVDGESNPMSGQQGARIASDRYSSNGHLFYPDKKDEMTTETCEGNSANRRDTFYQGWGASECADGAVSMEAMVRRFQARNSVDMSVSRSDLNAASGAVDEETLSYIGRDWQLYNQAYKEYGRGEDGNSRIGLSTAEFSNWAEQALIY